MKKVRNILIVLGLLSVIFIFVFLPPFNKFTKGVSVEYAASVNSDLFTNADKKTFLINKAENYFIDNDIEVIKSSNVNDSIEYQIKIDDVYCDVSFQRWKDVNYLYINCYNVKKIDKQKLLNLYNEFNVCEITMSDLERAIDSSDITKFTLSNKAYGEWNYGFRLQGVIF